MKPFLRLFAVTMIVLHSNSCVIPTNPLPSLWFYTYREGPATTQDNLLTPASFLEIRPDGSFTQDFGSFRYGTWSRKGQELYLTDQRHSIDSFSIGHVTLKEMQLTTGNGIVADFESQPLPSAKPSDDPYCTGNNQWRIRPINKESDEQIRKRILNHCQFWESYFTWALKNEISTVDVRSTPTPIKIYGNGFTLKPFEALPAIWKSYFFDAEDCQKASDMIRDIFQHQNIAWAHTDNKYKMFISAFQQLENYLH